MASATVADFGASTDASDVAAAFSTSVKGRTFLITGVNKLGVGYATAVALASQSPRRLILAGRSQAKLQDCADALGNEYQGVDFRPLVLDLGSQKSVRTAAAEVLSWEDTPVIDVVINNAAVMNIPKRTLSEDGIELHLATNHIGHFLFTNLIMAKIMASAANASPGAARVINVSSMATMVSPLRVSDLNWEKTTLELPEGEKPNLNMMKAAALVVDETMSYIPMGAYGQSKTANILYSVALNDRLHQKYGVTSVAVHPGEVKTELHRTTDLVWLKKTEEWRAQMNIGWKTLEQGASTALVAALDPKLGKLNGEGQGQFLSDCQPSQIAPPYALDTGKADELWAVSEKLVKDNFSW